jgi:hypothetical protein
LTDANSDTVYFDNKLKQAGAELFQAQAQVGLPAEAELMLSSMDVPSIFSKLFSTPLV